MDEKDIKLHMELAERLLQEAKTWTKEQALASLVSAGILDENGEYTQPYKEMLEEE
jgi:hypothetical protein